MSDHDAISQRRQQVISIQIVVHQELPIRQFEGRFI